MELSMLKWFFLIYKLSQASDKYIDITGVNFAIYQVVIFYRIY